MNAQRPTAITGYTSALSIALTLCAVSTEAGELNVTGDLGVASNLTAHAVTLGGETRTNWPSGGGASGATSLTTAVLDFSQTQAMFRFTLTNNTTWVFTNHVAGREVTLRLAQDATGGWTNTWPSDLLWPDGSVAHPSPAANHFNLFKIADDGTNWLALAQGLNYRLPCVSNCNYALQFDGSQNYVGASTAADLFPTETTIECWVYVRGLNDGAGLISCSTVGDGRSYQLGLYAGGNYPACEVSDGNGETVVLNNGSYVTITQDVWHHVALTFDATSVAIYVDGALADSASWSPNFASPSSSPLLIGAPAYSYLFGDIDEVRISSVVRYTSTFTPAHSFSVDSDTIAYYKFNEGSGSTAHDETSNHDSTLHGSPEPSWEDGN